MGGPPLLIPALHEVFISHLIFAPDYPIKQTIQAYLESSPTPGESSDTAVTELADILTELRKSDMTGRIEEAFPEQR